MGFLLSQRLAGIRRARPPLQPISFFGDSGQLITAIDEKLLGPDDFKTLTNIRYEDGRRRTREGLYKLTTSALGSSKYFKTIAKMPLAGTTTILGVSDDYKLYKITGTEGSMSISASAGTLNGDAQIISYGNKAMICDGSYLKTYDGTTLAIAYDDGDDGYGYDNTTANRDGSIALYDYAAPGDYEAVAQLFTTPNTGYTWLVTEIEIWMSKTGTPPAGAINGTVWNASSGAVVWSDSVAVRPVHLTGYAKKYKLTFASGCTLTANTQYRFGVTYSTAGSDSSNCVNIYYDTVASGGLVQTFDGTNWSATDTTKNLCIGIKPGLPPKASFGCVADTRLHLVDPDRPGGVWISKQADPYDWSSTDYSGWVAAVDDSTTTYPVGAIVPFLNAAGSTDVWVFGKVTQPFLCRLTGTSPTDWALALTGQEAYTDHKSVQSAVNDIVFSSAINCHSMQASDLYGDVRVGGLGQTVKNLFESYWTTSAFSGYWGLTGQYFIYLPTYGTMVCHTKDGARRWSRYTYKSLTESAYCGVDDKLYVACTDGHLYRLKSTQYTDAGTAYDITMHSGKLRLPFGDCELIVLATDMPTSGTTTANLSMYKNNSGTATHTIALSSATFPPEWKCGMNAHALQLKIDTVAFTADTYFEPIVISARKLYGLGQR